MLTRSPTLLSIAQFRIVSRLYGSVKGGISAAPDFPTGIEFQESHNKRGKQNPKSFEKEYKCIEYLNLNTWSYYDKEDELQQYRVKQPSYKHPDTEPKIKAQ